VISTNDHELHRQRRGYIANLFSKRSISDLESIIQSKVDKLVTLLKEANHTEETLIGPLVFGSLAIDVISHYAYGESFGNLDKPGFPCELERDVKAILMIQHVRRFLPGIDRLITHLPAWLVARISPSMVSFLDFETRIAGYSKAALTKSMEGEEPTKPRTVFDALVSSKIPAQERTLQRLTDESSTILIAGVDTTARTLTATMCYLILYPEILAKLRAELQPYKNATWTQLESLPYLVSHLLHFAIYAS
jgi:cytochrome P450